MVRWRTSHLAPRSDSDRSLRSASRCPTTFARAASQPSRFRRSGATSCSVSSTGWSARPSTATPSRALPTEQELADLADDVSFWVRRDDMFATEDRRALDDEHDRRPTARRGRISVGVRLGDRAQDGGSERPRQRGRSRSLRSVAEYRARPASSTTPTHASISCSTGRPPTRSPPGTTSTRRCSATSSRAVC